MLNEFSTQDYVFLKSIRLNDLALVNVIVGKNNSGKTFLLKEILFSELNPRIDFIIRKNVSFERLAGMWNQITLTSKESIIVNALRILHSDIQEINFVNDPLDGINILVKVSGEDDLLSFNSNDIGGGMQQILSIALAIATVEDGILLIDGIDSDLHHEIQADVWRFIFKMAQELSVQVFATTHSWDCISAFNEALQELEDKSVGKLFRLNRKREDERKKVVEYSPQDIDIAVRQNIEMR
jgi:AAA15 family ATPase/GTPase